MTVSVFRPIIVSSAEAIQEQLKENLGITLNIEVRESGQAEGEEVGIYRRQRGRCYRGPRHGACVLDPSGCSSADRRYAR